MKYKRTSEWWVRHGSPQKRGLRIAIRREAKLCQITRFNLIPTWPTSPTSFHASLWGLPPLVLSNRVLDPNLGPPPWSFYRYPNKRIYSCSCSISEVHNRNPPTSVIVWQMLHVLHFPANDHGFSRPVYHLFKHVSKRSRQLNKWG